MERGLLIVETNCTDPFRRKLGAPLGLLFRGFVRLRSVKGQKHTKVSSSTNLFRAALEYYF